MVAVQRMEPAVYERMASDPAWKLTELHDGIPREKPVMSQAHGGLMMALTRAVLPGLDDRLHRLRTNHAKLAAPGGSCFIPDLVVLPLPAHSSTPDAADLYHDPALLGIEIRSPSTGGFDLETNLPAYMLRGDAEIWLVLPERAEIVRWLRARDGGYAEDRIRAGVLHPAALPGVAVDLDALFGRRG
ncbi:MAG: Uma2 family endonuclease [Chloroflexota bacterium]